MFNSQLRSVHRLTLGPKTSGVWKRSFSRLKEASLRRTKLTEWSLWTHYHGHTGLTHRRHGSRAQASQFSDIQRQITSSCVRRHRLWSHAASDSWQVHCAPLPSDDWFVATWTSCAPNIANGTDTSEQQPCAREPSWHHSRTKLHACKTQMPANTTPKRRESSWNGTPAQT